ncbi:hypothetical protein FACS1894188_13650 [Clostridia bacterium]|nr:hypothetical protein FACS1894188_13650 [Clostridia bacterium]
MRKYKRRVKTELKPRKTLSLEKIGFMMRGLRREWSKKGRLNGEKRQDDDFG